MIHHTNDMQNSRKDRIVYRIQTIAKAAKSSMTSIKKAHEQVKAKLIKVEKKKRKLLVLNSQIKKKYRKMKEKEYYLKEQVK